VSVEAQELSRDKNFDLQAYTVDAKAEQTRERRVVRIGAIQNSIVLDTSEPVVKQRDAIFERVGVMIKAAAMCGVNVLCLQETWTMPFAFCTRERLPWTEFAENARDGPSTRFISELAKRYNMVIVSPILERDDAEHGDNIWNTAGQLIFFLL
jgi:beta-ureidopropionase